MKDKALLVIESLTSEGEAFDLDFEVMMGRIKDDRLIKLAEILGTIYKFAHIARNPSCIESHNAWVVELENAYQCMRKAGRI